MTSSCVVGHREGKEQQERKKEKERQKYEEIGNDAKIAEKTASNGANRESGSQYQEKSETDTGTNFESAKHSHNSKNIRLWN